MKMKSALPVLLIAVLSATVVVLAIDNAGLRRQLGAQDTRSEEPRRTARIAEAPRRPVRPKCLPMRPSAGAPIPARPTDAGGTNDFETAFKARIAQLRAKRAAERERRRERIRNLTPEEKSAQRDAFLTRMRERSTRRMKTFIERTGLNATQTAAFENTVSALGSSLGETATAWAETIRSTKSFNQNDKVKFISDVSSILSAGYGEMDATLPEDWKSEDGDVNLMEIVGPEALAPVVEALTENGLDDGLQTVGTVMGGPEGGEGGGEAGPGEAGPGEGSEAGPGEGSEGGPGEGGEGPGAEGPVEGGPGTGDGPGSGPGGGPGGGFGGGPGGR